MSREDVLERLRLLIADVPPEDIRLKIMLHVVYAAAVAGGEVEVLVVRALGEAAIVALDVVSDV